MNHLMVDIETLGNESGCVITSLAAVQFDIQTGEVGQKFMAHIDIQQQLNLGQFVQASTILWWLEQNDEARKKLIDGQKEAKNLNHVLYEFRGFVESLTPSTLQVWGNSNRFDLGILYAAHKAIGREIPWKHTLERDVRTLVSFLPEIKDTTTFHGVKHDPIADCEHQIKYCSKTYRAITNSIEAMRTLATGEGAQVVVIHHDGSSMVFTTSAVVTAPVEGEVISTL